MSLNLRLKLLKAFLVGVGVFLLFWWPLSHWFYPDFYHRLLGFKPGSYPENMVKIIGTTGILPVLLMLLAARNPLRNRDSIITLIVFSFLMAFTYTYLILSGLFPLLEYLNVGFSLSSAGFLIYIYPWGYVEDRI